MHPSDTATAANEAVHALLLEACEQFLEAVTRLDDEAMRARLARFTAQLDRHMRFEEDVAVVLLLDLAPESADEIARIEGDHRILVRCVAAARRLMDELAVSDAPRRTLVRRLGELNRLREVLEHHTLRESEHFYPLLDRRLDEPTRRDLAMRLDGQCAELD